MADAYILYDCLDKSESFASNLVNCGLNVQVIRDHVGLKITLEIFN